MRRQPIKRVTRMKPSATLTARFTSGLVNLYTRDIEAGIRFYRDLLGFSETFRTPAVGTPEHVEFRLSGFTVGLASRC